MNYTLTTGEQEAIKELIVASAANGHDFIDIDQRPGVIGKHEMAGYVGSLVKKEIVFPWDNDANGQHHTLLDWTDEAKAEFIGHWDFEQNKWIEATTKL